MSNRAYAVTLTPSSVDKAAGIIRGVAVITAGIAQGHNEEVDAITLAQVLACASQYAGGLKVVDRHTRSSDSIFATAGTLRNFRIDGGKVRADLHILATEPNKDKLLEMAETMPDTFGLSIAFSGPSESRDGKNFARCSEIYNAALVDVPAANPTGLFSAKFENGTGVTVDASEEANAMTPEDILKQCSALIASATTELSARLKAAEDKLAGSMKECSAATTSITELTAKLDAATKELSEKIADDAKRMELTAQTVAKEFARHVGTGPGVAPSAGGAAAVNPDVAKADAFVATALKHFAATKSKTKALDSAIRDDADGYKAFRSQNRDIKWA